MPITIYCPGIQIKVKGEDPRRNIRWRRFRRMAAATGINGHEIQFRKKAVLFIDPQPEAEYQKQLADQKAAQEKQEKEERESREKAEKARNEALSKAAEEFVAKYGPNPNGWPGFGIKGAIPGKNRAQ